MLSSPLTAVCRRKMPARQDVIGPLRPARAPRVNQTRFRCCATTAKRGRIPARVVPSIYVRYEPARKSPGIVALEFLNPAGLQSCPMLVRQT